MEFDLYNREQRIFFLYKCYFSNFDLETAIKELHQSQEVYNFNYLQEETIINILKKRPSLEKIIQNFLDSWRFENLNILERAVLLDGVAEILIFKIKPAIIIKELVIFSKKYCDKDAYKLINGTLNNFVKSK